MEWQQWKTLCFAFGHTELEITFAKTMVSSHCYVVETKNLDDEQHHQGTTQGMIGKKKKKSENKEKNYEPSLIVH